jgi:hypothetical protein
MGLIYKIPTLMTITTQIPVDESVFTLEDAYTVDVESISEVYNGTSHICPKTRPRSLTIVHQPDLAFNHQSQARRSLLSELQGAIPTDEVKASLWAFLQVCDLSKLSKLVASARTIPHAFFSFLEDTCLSVPLHWMQRPPQDYGSTPLPAHHPICTRLDPADLRNQRGWQRKEIGKDVF